MKILSVTTNVVTLELEAGPARFHALWLRDNARDELSNHADSNQRMFDITELPDPVTVESAEMVDGQLVVVFGPEGVAIAYDTSWLESHCYDGPNLLSGSGAVSWGGSELMVHRLAWSTSGDPEALEAATEALLRDGVLIVDGLNSGTEADLERPGSGVAEVAGLWGPVRATNYGDIFLVQAEQNPINLAFTSRALNVHTDNPYRRPVPGYQLLHCLVASEVGGVTVFVDGFRAAEVLRNDNPAALDLLATHSVPFRWSGGGFDLRNRCSLIEVEDGGPLAGAIRAVRYNNRSTAPFDLPYDEMEAYYKAFRAFALVLHRPELEYRFVLAPGECVIFDNERILHGRDGESDPVRLLKGCYLDRDWIQGRFPSQPA